MSDLMIITDASFDSKEEATDKSGILSCIEIEIFSSVNSDQPLKVTSHDTFYNNLKCGALP